MQHAAVWQWYVLLCIYVVFLNFLLLLSIPFLHFFYMKSGIDKSTEWSTIPACPRLMCLFNKRNTEGTNSSKKICLTLVYVLRQFVSGLILWLFGNLWFDDLCEE